MSADFAKISANIADVREKIARATLSSGRAPEEVTLIAATKSATPEQINVAISAGITDIGENRVQQLLEKYDHVNPVTWHFIGRLQTNKVKYIIDKVELIHSVDSLKLAEVIDKQARKISKIQKILVEINFFGESSKAGIPPENAEDFIKTLTDMPNIDFRGIMLMAPKSVVTNLLHKCKGFVIDLSRKLCHNSPIEIISFGMSEDYERAIRLCGSTAVRIGTDIFGRN